MKLEINLLPRAKKGAAVAVATMDVKDAFAQLATTVRDPWLIAAAVSVLVSVAAVGTLFASQRTRAEESAVRVDLAVQDSTRYARVLAARRRLTAERDSVSRQLGIIQSIDDTRYNWAHIFDEISRALPAYTWLTTIEQTSQAPLPPAVDTTKAKKGTAPVVDTAALLPVRENPLRFRVVGQTVDIQALTLFMRQLESSPFVQNVALTKSEIVIVEGKDVTQFELAAEYEVPARDLVRTSPLVIPVR